MAQDEKYLKTAHESSQDEAHPGTPLEPDELEPSPPEFQTATQGQRQEGQEQTQGHPTSALDSMPRGRRAGPIRSGTHPTVALHVKPRGQR